MKKNDAFGCTTFRKGNYLGRSYDFYCNDVASSVLHTSRIEGVRYESIGMSGSSFNGMKKDKVIDGTIDKATMNTLFSSIVDGINEKGVAISALVVPRGDKGITTGTNKGKDTIPAKMVPRVVLDKAYSAKNAVELLSTRNIVQNFGTDYELHWMIADGTDTYLVETVNNKLSYLGPRAIEGIEDLYSGTLEADVVTNFYQTGFSSAEKSGYIEGHSDDFPLMRFRAYEVTGLHDGESYVVVGTGNEETEDYPAELRVYKGDEDDSFKHGLYGAFSSAVFNPDKYYVVIIDMGDGEWKSQNGVGTSIDLSLPLYHENADYFGDTPLEGMPPLSEIPKKEEYNTFEMPINNPTVTPYGAGLERYKIIKDKLAQVNGDLADDEEAMGIINLVQYTNAYKSDNDWYSEFVDHEHDNRSELEGTWGDGYQEVATPEGSTHSDYRVYEAKGVTQEIYQANNKGQLWDSNGNIVHLFNHEGISKRGPVSGVDFSELQVEDGKYYIVICKDSTGNFRQAIQTSMGFTFGNIYPYAWDGEPGDDKALFSITEDIPKSEYIPSEYMKSVNDLRTTYQALLASGGKDAVRKIGLAWHSNHQCVYDLDNKTMLVYPSENGEHAFRVDVHGVVEDSAVEIGGGASVETLPLGGKVFYIDSNDNGATYRFYKEDGSEIKGWTDVASLADAVSYSIEGEPTSDRFYVFDNNLATGLRWTYHDGSDYKYEQIFTTPSATYKIGQGRINTQTVMSKDGGKYITDDSKGKATIWYVCNEVNKSERGGCSDWFIPSQNELNALRTSSVVPSNWFSSNSIRTSSEFNIYNDRVWHYILSNFADVNKSDYACCVCVRAF